MRRVTCDATPSESNHLRTADGTTILVEAIGDLTQCERAILRVDSPKRGFLSTRGMIRDGRPLRSFELRSSYWVSVLYPTMFLYSFEQYVFLSTSGTVARVQFRRVTLGILCWSGGIAFLQRKVLTGITYY